jgi:O-antigen biosynthesis protein
VSVARLHCFVSGVNPLEHPVCFLRPSYIAASHSLEHVPFLMFLTDLVRPAVLVELGTFTGVSYLGYCQAITELDLATRAFAVFGRNGNERGTSPEELQVLHDARYGSFSKLVPTDPREALSEFEDGSVDLLHLDAGPEQGAVKREVETWRPKLSKRAVVVVGGIRSSDSTGGGAPAWDEMAAEFPHIEFPHSGGLGVLAVGQGLTPSAAALFESSNEELEALCRFFSILGERASLLLDNDRLTLALQDRERRAQRQSDLLLEKSLQTADLHAQLVELKESRTWKVASSLLVLRGRVAPTGTTRESIVRASIQFQRIWRREGGRPALSSLIARRRYRGWVRASERRRFQPLRAAKQIEQLQYKPVISIVMPVYNPPLTYLRAAIDSVRRQYYARWELCICNDASPDAGVRDLLDEYGAGDPRIKVKHMDSNGGISAASNMALKLATGEYVGLLDHDDLLTPDALYEVATALQDIRADLVYSDEDKLDPRGRRCDPFFKPAWSPDLLLSCMYTSHFSVYRKSLVDRAGGFRPEFDGSQDYDLALRCTEVAEHITHIPKILYHWRMIPTSASDGPYAKPYAYEAAQRALTDAMRRRSIAAEVIAEPFKGFFRVKRSIDTAQKVTVVIPTRDQAHLLRLCVSSIEALTDYPNYEIIIIDNGSQEAATLRYLAACPHRVIRCDEPFNHSRLNNIAANHSDGTFLLLLNDDTEVLTPEWMSAMVEQAQRPEVGAVGAKLLYPDGRIQHAGIILGVGGIAGHAGRFRPSAPGVNYFSFTDVVRDYTAVTGACLMIRRDLYLEIGGLNEDLLPTSYNDVDLCLRLRERGYLNVYSPYAVLIHNESVSRGRQDDEQAISYLTSRWGTRLLVDPFFNPNQSGEDFSGDLTRMEAGTARRSTIHARLVHGTR